MAEADGGGWTGLVLLVLLIALGALTFLAIEARMDAATARGPAVASGRSFELPDRPVDAAAVLGHPRAAVRSTLGAPVEVTPDRDRFDVGVPLSVTYADDVAVGLQLRASRAARHHPVVLTWLGLPPYGPIELGGVRYQLGLLPKNHDLVAVVRVEPEPQPPGTPQKSAPSPARAAPAPAPAKPLRADTAGALLAMFPRTPGDLADRCTTRQIGRAVELDCRESLDAKVTYDFGTDSAVRSLTVVDPPAASQQDTCLGWVVKALPDAVPAGARDGEEDAARWWTRGAGHVVARWSRERGGVRAGTCAVVACAGAEPRCQPPAESK